MQNEINIAIITVPRPDGTDYLHKTLVSLLTNSRQFYSSDSYIHIFNGSYNNKWLSHLESSSRFRIHNIDDDRTQEVRLDDMTVTEKFNLNYFTCLNYFAKQNKSLYMFEDDVLFTQKAFDKCFQARWELEKTNYIKNYALTLYSALGLNVPLPVGEECIIVQQPPHSFWGTQGIFWEAETLLKFVEYFKKVGLSKDSAPADMIVKDYFDDPNNTGRLFIIFPSVCQHFGVRSNGLDKGNFHSSPSFVLK